MTPAQERFEHMVAMAMEAWDATRAVNNGGAL